MSNIKEIFERVTVDTLQTPKGLVIVDSDLIPVQGFNLILDNKIQSAPVYDKSTKKYTGFLDIRDLVSFMIFLNDTNVLVQADTFLDIVNFGIKMFKHHSDSVTVTYLSRRNQFKELISGSTLAKAVEFMATGLHRIPIKDKDDNLVNIVSQSSIIEFIFKNCDSNNFQELSKKISELTIGTAPVLSVSHNTPAIEAFRLMDHHRRSGIAIVDGTKLVGVTSSRDLKLFIRTPSVLTLQLPITQFLSKLNNPHVLITGSNDETLQSIIEKMVSSRLHRIFIIDPDQNLLKVISISDILKLINKKIHEQ